jgi:hypothetical protein
LKNYDQHWDVIQNYDQHWTLVSCRQPFNITKKNIPDTPYMKHCYPLLVVLSLLSGASHSQTPKSKFNLYEQSSEIAGLVIQYTQDIRAVGSFYSPMLVRGRGFAAPTPVLNSPEQRKRLNESRQKLPRKVIQS